MDAAPLPVDLDQLRQSCARCSLQQLCLPAGIGADGLARLDTIVKKRRPIARGERLFRSGQVLGALFVAREGAFKTVCPCGDGDELILGFHLPGELIGLDALGSGEHRCEALALTTASVCEVPLDQLNHVAAELPGLQRQLLKVIGQSMDRDQDHTGLLARRQANERIALFLHGLGERYRNIGRSPHAFRLPMSREDIARYLGLALETVSRGFTRLQDDGVIEVSGRQVSVLRPDALDHLAHGDGEPVGARGHA
jgi:CRP/FNR family transcriptional regulator